jgi:hypothetical protein
MEKKSRWLQGKERNAVRSILRKALKQNKLMIRTIYCDYYDSCTAPKQTPDAEFQLIVGEYEINSVLSSLKAGGDSIVDIGMHNVYQLNTGYSTKEVKVIDTKLEKLLFE